jgi:2-haloacid dehalogenase
VNTAVFDLGGVLVDWDPRYLLRKLMPHRETEMEELVRDVLNASWNLERDKGDSWAEAIDVLKAEHPRWSEVFDLYTQRWAETLGGSHEDTVAVLRELRDGGVPLYALSNWSAEMFPHAEARFDWLTWFDGVVVSGRVGKVKPDREIFEHLIDAYGLRAEDLFFTDDHEANVIAARSYGIYAHHFRGAGGLRAALVEGGLLDGTAPRT